MSSDKKFLATTEKIKKSLRRVIRGSTLTLVERANAIEWAASDISSELKAKSRGKPVSKKFGHFYGGTEGGHE